jgi:8-oxo-dGTP pyrophosphatase MutT (NUDIX family)
MPMEPVEEINIELQDTQWPMTYTDHDREIVRAIVVDDAGSYYFVRAVREDDFGAATLIETSGGGVEPGESLDAAIRRELMEELGAEVEMCFGPEMEKHILTRSCCLRIPGGLPHGFYHINSCTRPWLFIEVQEANPKTEKFLWEYLTPEELASIPEDRMKNLWVDVGFD